MTSVLLNLNFLHIINLFFLVELLIMAFGLGAIFAVVHFSMFDLVRFFNEYRSQSYFLDNLFSFSLWVVVVMAYLYYRVASYMVPGTSVAEVVKNHPLLALTNVVLFAIFNFFTLVKTVLGVKHFMDLNRRLERTRHLTNFVRSLEKVPHLMLNRLPWRHKKLDGLFSRMVKSYLLRKVLAPRINNNTRSILVESALEFVVLLLLLNLAIYISTGSTLMK